MSSPVSSAAVSYLALCAQLIVCAAVSAQPGVAPSEPPPKGPAEIIKRTGAARNARDNAVLEQSGNVPPANDPVKGADSPAARAAGTPPAAAPGGEPPQGHPSFGDNEGDAQPPVGNDPHAGAEGAPALARRPLATQEPSAGVPGGSIRVHVFDGQERPAANAELQLGVMASDGRTSKPARTGSDGTFVFDQLPTGDKQAYRVNLLFNGAKYSSMPFRLTADRGYDVTLRQLETTHDDREIVLYVGATSIELRDERLKVVQQARLVNIGSKTYLFPEGGQLVRLPAGVLTFQSEEVMTDQHIRQEKDVGMRVSGSVPPGEVTLTWGYDLPLEGTQLDLGFDLPWVTFAYRVLVDAVPGMGASVEGFPEMELHDENGRRFLVTEIVKRAGESPLRNIKIHVHDIPGPGPMRIIAVVLAVLVLGIGIYFARAPLARPLAPGSAPDLSKHRERILARARELEAERARGDIGPEFHDKSLRELEEELAAILYEQRRAGSARAGGADPGQTAS